MLAKKIITFFTLLSHLSLVAGGTNGIGSQTNTTNDVTFNSLPLEIQQLIFDYADIYPFETYLKNSSIDMTTHFNPGLSSRLKADFLKHRRMYTPVYLYSQTAEKQPVKQVGTFVCCASLPFVPIFNYDIQLSLKSPNNKIFHKTLREAANNQGVYRRLIIAATLSPTGELALAWCDLDSYLDANINSTYVTIISKKIWSNKNQEKIFLDKFKVKNNQTHCLLKMDSNNIQTYKLNQLIDRKDEEAHKNRSTCIKTMLYNDTGTQLGIVIQNDNNEKEVYILKSIPEHPLTRDEMCKRKGISTPAVKDLLKQHREKQKIHPNFNIPYSISLLGLGAVGFTYLKNFF